MIQLLGICLRTCTLALLKLHRLLSSTDMLLTQEFMTVCVLQLAMLNHKTEQEQAQATITQLHLQQQQQQRQQHLDSQDCLSLSEAAELTQQLADLNKQNSDLGSNNAELSTDLGRALDVAQRVMEQKQGLQEQCRLQQEQLKQEQHRVHELEGTPPLCHHCKCCHGLCYMLHL